MIQPLHIGFIYPLQGAVDDYRYLAASLVPPVKVTIVRTPTPRVHHADEWLDNWHYRHLLDSAWTLQPRRVAACMWACTSGSFVFGVDGAKQQAAKIARVLNAPTSSTSLAFLAALDILGIKSVAVAATYPNGLASVFRSFLVMSGVDVVHLRCMEIWSGAEVAVVKYDDILRFVQANDHPKAEAILIPDTALQTGDIIAELENKVGKIILTANVVTLWEGLRLAGYRKSQSHLGYLMAQAQDTDGVT